MPDTLKTIRRTKETVKDLRSRSWTNNKIGISNTLLVENHDYDPLSVRAQEKTLEKLKSSHDNHPIRRRSPTSKHIVNKEIGNDFCQIKIPKSMWDSIPHPCMM